MAEATHILIICGEPSGDLQAGNLVKELLKLDPSLSISAVGGKNLSEIGADIYQDIKELTVFGLSDVLKKLPKFFALKKLILERINSENFKAVILVDFAGFNLRLAKAIKKRVPVIYYISPQVWASRRGRIKTIKKYISKMVVLFKFEEEFYKRYGIDVDFVGHPLLDIVKPTLDKKEFMDRLGFSELKTTIALFPGSRQQEVENILPIMLEAADYIKRKTPCQFVVAKPSYLDYSLYEEEIKRFDLPIKIVEDKPYDCLNIADFALVCSGTATLETTLMEKPFLIIYKTNLLNYLLYRPQIRVPFVGMVNIVANKKIIPEFIQFKAKPKEIAQLVLKLLNSPLELEKMKNQLSYVRSLLGPSLATKRAAKLILDFIKTH